MADCRLAGSLTHEITVHVMPEQYFPLTTISRNSIFQSCRTGPGNRPYKCMIYRDGLVGAASQTAPTNGLEPPLQMISVVVQTENMTQIEFQNLSYRRTESDLSCLKRVSTQTFASSTTIVCTSCVGVLPKSFVYQMSSQSILI